MGLNRRRRLVRGSILSSTGYGLAAILVNIGLLPLIIQTVGAAPYGVWILLTTISTFLWQADLGLGAAVTRDLAASREDATRSTTTVTSAFAWTGLAGIAAAPLYLGIAAIFTAGHLRILNPGELPLLIGLGATLVLLLGLRVFSSALRGIGLWSTERNYQFVGLGIRLVGTVVVCLTSHSILHLAFVETLALLLPTACAVLHACTIPSLRPSRRAFSAVRAKELLHFSVRAFVVGATGSLLLQSGVMIVGIVGTPEAVTIYSAAFRVYGAIRQVMTWVSDPFLPTLTMVASRDPASFRMRVLDLLGLAWLTCCAMTILLIFVAPELLRIWLGAPLVDGTAVTLVLQVLLVSLIPNALHIAAVTASNAAGRPGAFLKLHLVWLALTWAIALPLGSAAGIVGVAIGFGLPIVLLEPLYIRRVLRTFDVSLRTWSTHLLLPPMVLIVPATLAGLACSGTMAWLGISAAAFGGSAAFALVLAALVIRARHSPHMRRWRLTMTLDS